LEAKVGKFFWNFQILLPIGWNKKVNIAYISPHKTSK